MKISMKLGLLMATAISFATLPALAQQDDGPGLGQGQKFQEIKAKILQRMKDGQACVEAAQDFEALADCRPRGGQGGGRRGGDGPPSGDQDGGDSGGNND